MTYTSDIEILDIYTSLLARTLPKSAWTHAAHFAAAIAIVADPVRDAEKEMPAIIRAYNDATGVVNDDNGGYHHAITLASLRAVKMFIGKVASEKPLYEIANMMLADKWGRPDWIFEHWSRDRLFSVEARRRWVGPDLKPLS